MNMLVYVILNSDVVCYVKDTICYHNLYLNDDVSYDLILRKNTILKTKNSVVFVQIKHVPESHDS